MSLDNLSWRFEWEHSRFYGTQGRPGNYLVASEQFSSDTLNPNNVGALDLDSLDFLLNPDRSASLGEFGTSEKELHECSLRVLEMSETHLSRVGVSVASLRSVFMRFGYTEIEHSYNYRDLRDEPGLSVFRAVYDPTLDVWCPSDANTFEIIAALYSCRGAYLLTGDVVAEEIIAVPAFPNTGVCLANGYRYLAGLRFFEDPMWFRVNSIAESRSEDFSHMLERDKHCYEVRHDNEAMKGISWDRDWWSDPDKILPK